MSDLLYKIKLHDKKYTNLEIDTNLAFYKEIIVRISSFRSLFFHALKHLSCSLI